MREKSALTPEEKRIQKIAQLRAKLQKEEGLLNEAKRKERDGQLIAFGIYIEEFYKTAGEEKRQHLESGIRALLKGRNLERALAGMKRLADSFPLSP